MTPRDYASTFSGQAGGTLRRRIAPRTGLLPPTNTKVKSDLLPRNWTGLS
jgi:hypothetical protein